ncbi:MAG: VOC family protein [Phycisphaerae bacterium]
MTTTTLKAFHHVGIAVQDIVQAANALTTLFSADAESGTIDDPRQGVRVKFMTLGDLRIELVEPAGSPSPLDSILKRGIGLYHVCHEVADLDKELDRLKTAGARIIAPPKPAAAFDGRQIAFVMCEGLMVELLEAAPATST